MGVETALIIGAASAVAAGGASYYSAQQQNKAAKRAAGAQYQAAQVQTKQLEDQAALERIKRLREMASIEGRVKVSAAGAGLASDNGSFAALGQQAQGDATENLAILQKNVANQKASIASGLQVNLDQLAMQKRTPGLDAFSGFVGGASTGLSIGSGIQNINNAP